MSNCPESITAKKFFTGAVQPKTGLKALAFLPWLLLFGFIGFACYKAYFKKPPATQNQTFIVQPGASMTVQQKQEAAPKKKWWVPSPYVDLYSFVETDDRSGFGCRFGAHWEW